MDYETTSSPDSKKKKVSFVPLFIQHRGNQSGECLRLHFAVLSELIHVASKSQQLSERQHIGCQAC